MKNTVLKSLVIALTGALIISVSITVSMINKANVKIASIERKTDKTIIELTDKSFAIIKDGKYYFQPVNMGDWDYEFSNKSELDKAIETYIENCNN